MRETYTKYQKSMQNAWYIWKSQKKVAISRGRCAHRCHHAAAKCILFFRNIECITRFARSFSRNKPWVPVFFQVFWAQKTMQNAWDIRKNTKKVVISIGRCAHRCHHAAAKCILFFESELCIMHFARYLGGYQVWEPVFFSVFRPHKSMQNAWDIR